MTGKDWAELLKFPLTILVGFFAIVVAAMLLEIKPTEVAIGEVKVKLETEIRQDLANSNIKMEELVRDLLRAELKKVSLRGDSARIDDIILKDTASDNVAQLAKIRTEGVQGTVFKSTIGYIWLGNYTPSTKKFYSTINVDDLNLVDVGQRYYVNGNMVIRENSPVQNVNYYRGEKNIGIAVKGFQVKVLEKPQIKQLKGYSQYWAKIEVLE